MPTPGREAGPDVCGSGKPVSGFGEPPPHQAASIKPSCARRRDSHGGNKEHLCIYTKMS